MKKNGFTLAEVLITLAMIGVIATMTLPALMYNIQKQQVGPALMKALNSLQNANDLALVNAQARTLDKITDDGKYFDGALQGVLLTTPYGSSIVYKTFDMASDSVTATTSYISKDNISYFLAPEGITQLGSKEGLGRRYSGNYYTVYVDINGPQKKPNAAGKDLFTFLVDTKGAVIPYGGSESQNYIGDGSWEDNCNAKEVKDAKYCAGAIIDNNGAVTYKY